MLKQTLIELLTRAAAEAQKSGRLPSAILPEVTIERPQNPEHGDYASSISLKMARATGVNPMTIAQEIVSLIVPTPEVDRAVVAPPGFINFTLKDDWLTSQVAPILDEGDAYGNIELGAGSRTQIEFVSVNPTGPLHVGHGRGAILGSTLANVLTAAEKEHYTNDAGSQIDTFALTLYPLPAVCQY